MKQPFSSILVTYYRYIVVLGLLSAKLLRLIEQFFSNLRGFDTALIFSAVCGSAGAAAIASVYLDSSLDVDGEEAPLVDREREKY